MKKCSFLLGLALVVTLAPSLRADDRDNVRAVQTKLHDGGYYFGEIDGAYSSDLAGALSRYQIRNGLPITGQLDVDTAKALDAKPAVTASVGSTGKPSDSAQSSDTWRKLRKSDQHLHAGTNSASKHVQQEENHAAGAAEPIDTSAASPPAEGPATVTTQNAERSSGPNIDRLRDYVAAFVLAGLDPQVGAEAEFFGDRVRYFNEGVKDRETIRQELSRYAERWPERKFWLAGDIKVEAVSGAGDQLRVTFPLRFDLRNGAKHSSGKVEKTIVLKPAGNDYEIVAVDERNG